ncbi:putative nuclease HARBI1 [Stomoxys calcitrans]|uniref:putative nuclease HARBI1 n=1 Tax=Stomoxys calcitrans TaxID=35570 RepID=UPI0027E37463|nr:putative nuclease HARBI1 [Stomoxys calcitrans]
MLSVANFSSSDEEDETNAYNLICYRRQIRIQSNIFSLPSSKFVSNFRLNKASFRYVLRTISQKLRDPSRSTCVPKTLRLAATLRILAEGSYQKGAGNDFNVGLAQPTMSCVFHECIDAMYSELCSKWITFKMSEREKMEIKEHFYGQTRFPGVIGCIDGTHIKILAPTLSERWKYYNRKGFYSLNVMVVCDHKLRIRYISPSHPGSAHDSLVWNVSDLKAYLAERYNNGERNTWLLGDAGYPLEPYLITPFRAAEEGSAESRFNTVHSKARNIVERTIGVAKNRFRCLLGARQLHYSPEMAAKITAVCAALHNICIHYKLDHSEFEIPLENQNSDGDYNENNGDMTATSIRLNIMNTMNV